MIAFVPFYANMEMHVVFIGNKLIELEAKLLLTLKLFVNRKL